MVWGLFPIESLPGSKTYYIFTKGTYTVGRKDCDVIIQTDRAISRLHAEIVIDNMSPSSPSDESCTSKIRIRDHSKFGTYINKELSIKAVHSYPDKEKILKDGDVISFGTGNASFRFCFINLIVFVGCSMNFQADSSLHAVMSSVGARTTYKWSPDCTHVLAEESSAVTSDLVDAIIKQKPIIQGEWFKILAEKSVRSEIPECSSYAPTMLLDGACVKIADPKARGKCLEGYTFVVGSMHLYKFGNKFAELLQLVGANVIKVKEFSTSSQNTAGDGNKKYAFVDPIKPATNLGQNQLDSLYRVSELELIIAAFSGVFKPLKLVPPSIMVSSSHSTDETIVAESQMEVDTATSDHIIKIKLEDAIEHEKTESTYYAKEVKHDADTEIVKGLAILSPHVNVTGFTQRKYEDNEPGIPGSQSADILYSRDLIVKDLSTVRPIEPISQVEVVNFKRFRKNAVEYGNNFGDLVPFAKEAYYESDFRSNDVTSFMREEKRRKQMEAVAEDLFNSSKAKKRGSAGASILSYFSRS